MGRVCPADPANTDAGRTALPVLHSCSRAVGVAGVQEEYQSACKRTERAESEALSAEVALRDERVQNRAAAAKLQDELDKCAHFLEINHHDKIAFPNEGKTTERRDPIFVFCKMSINFVFCKMSIIFDVWLIAPFPLHRGGHGPESAWFIASAASL